MNTALIVLGVIAGATAFAGLRGSLEHMLWAVCNLPFSALAALGAMLTSAQRHVAGSIATTRQTLAYPASEDRIKAPPRPATWDAIGPFIYFGLLVVILTGDLVLASLRFGALLGIEITDLPITGSTLDVLTGLLFIAVLATFGCAWFDLTHVTPLHRPYGRVAEPTRKLLSAVAATGAVLSVFAGVSFLVWGQGALAGNPNDDLATAFVGILAALLVGAGILAFGGAIAIIPAAWLLVLLLTARVLATARWVGRVFEEIIDKLYAFSVFLVRLGARPGEIIWNWLTSFDTLTDKVHLRALPDHDEPRPLRGRYVSIDGDGEPPEDDRPRDDPPHDEPPVKIAA